MPARSAEEKLRRRLAMDEKKAARAEAKARKEKEKQAKKEAAERSTRESQERTNRPSGPCYFVDMSIPDVVLSHVYTYLSASELGCAILTCRHWNYSIGEARLSYLTNRLSFLCDDTDEARKILKQSMEGGETRRIITRKQRKSEGRDADEFIGYARFLEEGICGYSKLSLGKRQPIFLPVSINGRYASVSPEHSLVRIGGDGQKSGPGGSGVASWGVGKRGQLGHGKREDGPEPKMLLGGIGYGIRIVQVSAGGGLVRVAHSLLLTSTGRVLSFGCGSYGQLGHGYSDGKTLPDYLRPKYIDYFNGMKCICVSAGELHSAVVTSDGDLFTFGDGFCGQIGHGDKRPRLEPKQVESGGLEDECVTTVACGNRHTLAVTEEGEVFSFGLGHFGVLGRSYTPFDYDADAAVAGLTGDLEEDPDVGAAAAAAAVVPAPDRVPPPGRHPDAELAAHLDLIANLTLDDSSDQCYPKVIDSLQGVFIVGASAGHRHSMLLDKDGGLYTFGSGVTGALGHGDNQSQMFPMRLMEFVHNDIKIGQFSAGVDLSMAVSTSGDVYSWGKMDGGRLGLGHSSGIVRTPRKVILESDDGEPLKAIDVECGYVHSLIVGLNGTLHQCGGVGTDGAADGQQVEVNLEKLGRPHQIPNMNLWHRVPEPKEVVKTERWKKYGKYELKGRSGWNK